LRRDLIQNETEFRITKSPLPAQLEVWTKDFQMGDLVLRKTARTPLWIERRGHDSHSFYSAGDSR
jgi:hypothetical protein